MALQLKVTSITCPCCVDTVTAAIQKIDATATVTGDPDTKVVNVETSANEDAVRAAITNAGHLVE
ncbi:MAG: heavy-metal-associated domain-containing protein [Cyanobacteria bacterium P01_D01_bin.73]